MQILRGKSIDMAKTFNKSIDLIFIDGDHSYNAVKADVLAWLPHLKPHGVIIMHDFAWATGVQQVVKEIIKPRQSEKGHMLQNTYWTRL